MNYLDAAIFGCDPEPEPTLAVGSSVVVQPWWVTVPWQNYEEMGECPQCVRCGVFMKPNSPDSEWGEDDDAIFNVCNACAASLLSEMWQRLNDPHHPRQPGTEAGSKSKL